MNAKQTALDAYLARTAAIHAKLERRLQQLADAEASAGPTEGPERLPKSASRASPENPGAPDGPAGRKRPSAGFRYRCQARLDTKLPALLVS